MISEQEGRGSLTGGAHFSNVLSVAVSDKGEVYGRIELLSK